jgi:hypothetical protein
MKSIEKAKPNKGKSGLQASTDPAQHGTRETPAKVKRGFKRPRRELEDIIRLVNMLPDNPPPLPLTTEQANDLPRELNDYLMAEYDAQLAETENDTHSWDYMEWQYKEIVESREALRQLMREAQEVSDEETIYFHESIDARAYLLISKERTVKVQMSPFARAIEGAEIDYLRYCQTCSNIFYAGRRNQLCCTPKCAKAQRQKRWRQSYRDGQSSHYKEKAG